VRAEPLARAILTRMATRPRPKAVLLFVLVVVLVNLPLTHAVLTRWRVEHSGVDVAASVIDHGVLVSDGRNYVLAFRYGKDIDPQQQTWTAEVDHATYDRAVEDGTVPVRVLPDDPAAYRTAGEVTHRTGLLLTGLADLGLLLVLLLLWRLRGRLRPRLEAVAVGDVEASAPGSALDRLEGDVYLIRGRVSVVADDEIVLDLGDRSVRVVLDGHDNPVPHEQPAQVRGRLVG
jgi:hypothetical protein